MDKKFLTGLVYFLVCFLIVTLIIILVPKTNTPDQQNILLVSNIYSSDGLTVIGYRIIDYAYNTICYINSIQGIWCTRLQ